MRGAIILAVLGIAVAAIPGSAVVGAGVWLWRRLRTPNLVRVVAVGTPRVTLISFAPVRRAPWGRA